MGNNKCFTWLGDMVARQVEEMNGELTIGVKEYIGGTSLENCQGVRFAAYINGVEKNPKAFSWSLDDSFNNTNIASQVGNVVMFTENNGSTKFSIKALIQNKSVNKTVDMGVFVFASELAEKYNIPIDIAKMECASHPSIQNYETSYFYGDDISGIMNDYRTNSSTKIKVKVNVSTITNSWGALIKGHGTNADSNNRIFLLSFNGQTSTTWSVYMGNTNKTFTGAFNKDVEYTLDQNALLENGVTKVSLAQNISPYAGNVTFAVGYTGKCYGCEMYENNILMHKFVPTEEGVYVDIMTGIECPIGSGTYFNGE